jgi:transmembrane protein TMEM174 (potassium channel)
MARTICGHGLAGQWLFFAAYVVSFFTIEIIWINHHILFDRMARVDRAVLYLNSSCSCWSPSSHCPPPWCLNTCRAWLVAGATLKASAKCGFVSLVMVG